MPQPFETREAGIAPSSLTLSHETHETSGLSPAHAAAVAAIRNSVIFGSQEAYDQVQQPTRAAVTALGSRAFEGLTYQQEAHVGIEQLYALKEHIPPSSEMATDLPRLFSLFDWAAVAAPEVFPVLSGHFNLTSGAIQRLGDPNSQWQQARLRELDTTHTGVFLLTELGYGSNVHEMETEARVKDGHFVFDTPSGAAIKFMPNVAVENGRPVMGVVAARLIGEDEKDEGVYPFIIPMDGTVDGIDIKSMPEKGFGPMTNAVIRFVGAKLPLDAMLTGGTGKFDQAGRFVSDLSLRERFTRTVEQLQSGRLALSGGAVATARAAAVIATEYAGDRLTAGGTPMIERDNVQRHFASAIANIVVMSAFSNASRELFADKRTSQIERSFIATLAKPLLSDTAFNVLRVCRERMGAQGTFRKNRITDYIDIVQGVITAEGENDVLRVSVGRVLSRLSAEQRAGFTLDRSGVPPSHFQRMLVNREKLLGETSHEDETVFGPSSLASDLATATANRLALEAMTTATHAAPESVQGLLRTVGDVFALEKIIQEAGWYFASGLLTPEEFQQHQKALAEGYKEIAANMKILTEAFDIPDLDTPATGGYIQNWLRMYGWEAMGGYGRSPRSRKPS